MADITVRNQGLVDDSGKVNWRGDQSVLPQGSQSVYKNSSIQLAELGSRKVVGDRVFRYAKAGGAITAGTVLENKAETLISVTGGGTAASGGKTFTWYAATAMSKDTYAEGYLVCGSGTASHMGHMYRIKSHAAIAKTTNGTLNLYDPLQLIGDVVDEYCIMQNPYINVQLCTTGAATLVSGVAPIDCTTNDYFWLQTWGPANVKCGAAAKADMVMADVTGQCIAFTNSSAGAAQIIVGHTLVDATASEWGLVYLTIAP